METVKKSDGRLPIGEAGFSPFTYECLISANILTIGHLTFCTKEQLLEEYKFDDNTIKEIESKLNEYGWKLATQEELDEMYEDDMKMLEEMEKEYSNEAFSRKITHEDIVCLYKSRYFNEKNIKKYEKIDEEKLKNVISNIKEEYLDFVYSVIMANDVQFSIGRRQQCVYAEPDVNGVIRTKVFSTLDDKEGNTFLHEMGHAASLCLCEDRSKSYNLLCVENPQGKTLEDVVKDEILQNKDKIKEKVLEAHREVMSPILGKAQYESISENADFLKEYYKLSRSLGGNCGIFIPSFRNARQNTPKFRENYARYLEMDNQVVEKAMIATRNKLVHNEQHKKFRAENETVLDVLSSVCDMDYPYDLEMHTQKYYEKWSKHQVGELWANLFAIKVAGKEDLMENVRKYLPKTCDSFEYIFDKIQQFYELQKAIHRW